MHNKVKIPLSSTIGDDSQEIDFSLVTQSLWQGKWLIATGTCLSILLSLWYAFTTASWYRAEVVLSPADSPVGQGLASQLGGLGGLASLAGLSIPSGSNGEAIAVLRSRDFARQFIVAENLLPVLFADDWDSVAKRWSAMDQEDWPDERDGVRYFNRYVRFVLEDKKAGLVTLAIEWKDPVLAADWANLFVSKVNERLRQRAIREAQENVSYLQRELASASVVTLQQSIGRLLETELQKLMLARGREEFAFRVLDRAEVPKWRASPNRLQIVGLAALLGFLASITVVLFRSARLRSAFAGNQRSMGTE